MKRQAILLCLCCLLSQIAAAQSQVYHNVGDTIYGRSDIYHYQWWTDDFYQDPEGIICFGFGVGNGARRDNLLRYCYTENTLSVVGLAASFRVRDNLTRTDYVDTLVWDEYLYLYDAYPDSFPLKKAVPVHPSDPYRYISLQLRYAFNDPCCPTISSYSTQVHRMYEYYFDKPVFVEDSFYVGGSVYSEKHDWTQCDTCESGFYHERYKLAYGVLGRSDPPLNMCPTCPTLSFLYKFYAYELNRWMYENNGFFMLVFPIIEIDTTNRPDPHPQDTFACPPVGGFQVASISGETVWLMWNSNSEHDSWELSYGPAGITPEQGTVVPVSGPPIYAMTGLDSCRLYSAYIRPVCHHGDSTCYGEWVPQDTSSGQGRGLDVYLCDSMPPVGIPNTPLEQFTYVVPSPASDQVQVMSGFKLLQVDVYDLSGETVYSAAASSVSTSIDVSSWPQGVYIAVIHTQGGIVTRKVVVSR